MIKLPDYDTSFIDKYSNVVSKIVSKLSEDDLNEIKKDIHDLFPRKYKNYSLEDISKLKYYEIKEIVEKLDKTRNKRMKEISNKENTVYKRLIKKYDTLRDFVDSDQKNSNRKMSIVLVDQLGLTVCPYCNRDFINCRSDKKSGAQLDHFYPKSKYPFFALSIYNLIPCCYNCNHTKLESDVPLSPFDITYNFEEKIFDFEMLDIDEYKITINESLDERLEENLSVFRIEEAYAIHSNIVKSTILKNKVYNSTQIEELETLVNESIKGTDIKNKSNANYKKYLVSKYDIKKEIFDIFDREESFLEIPFSKLRKDISESLKEI